MFGRAEVSITPCIKDLLRLICLRFHFKDMHCRAVRCATVTDCYVWQKEVCVMSRLYQFISPMKTWLRELDQDEAAI